MADLPTTFKQLKKMHATDSVIVCGFRVHRSYASMIQEIYTCFATTVRQSHVTEETPMIERHDDGSLLRFGPVTREGIKMYHKFAPIRGFWDADEQTA